MVILHSTEPVTAKEVESEILWNKICITIDRTPFNHGEWNRNNMLYVKYLQDKNGTFYSHSKIGDLVNVKCSFLDILHVRIACPETG